MTDYGGNVSPHPVTRSLIALAVAVAAIAIAVFALRSPSPTGADAANNTSSPSPMASQAPAAGASPSGKAPAALAQAAGAPADPAAPVDASKPWTTQPVKADANPQVASVAEAARTGKNPERLSPMIAPSAFDAEAWAQDPTLYLNVVEPGRVFQTATPSPTTPVLMPASPLSVTLEKGASGQIRVKAPPGSPVSWTSFDLGSFDNHLAAITVRADDQGFASVTFTASSGVTGKVNILAGSPLASGQVRFVVDVQGSSVTPVPPKS